MQKAESLTTALLKHASKEEILASTAGAEIRLTEEVAKELNALARDGIKENSIKPITNINKVPSEAKDLFKFTRAAANRMDDPNRAIPINILNEIIQNPLTVMNDSQGTLAQMYYGQIWKNGKLYNAEVLYDKANNTIMHFLYSREELGPLSKIKIK